MPEVLRGDQRLVFDVSGQGPAVLLAHNLLSHRGSYAEVAARLAGRARVLSVDLRAHGESGAVRGGFTTLDLADDLAAVLDAAGAEQAVLVGTSIGAAAALELALRRPERVRGLVLLAATPHAATLADRATFAALAAVLRALGPGPVLGSVLGRLHGASAPAAVRAASAAQIRAMRRRDAALAVQAWAGRAALTGRLSGVRAPARVVVGVEDTSCPRGFSEALARELAAPVAAIARAGHTLQAERPDAVAAQVEALLDELQGDMSEET